MRKLSLFLFVSLLLFSCTEVPTEAPQDAVKSNDSFAQQTLPEMPNSLGKSVSWDLSVNFRSGDGGTAGWRDGNVDGYISLSRDKTRKRIWLYYWVRVSGERVEYGYGDIPYDDVDGSYEQGWLRLDTDTSEEANPNFRRRDGSGGRVTVHWRRTPEWWREWGGYNVFSRGEFTYGSNGRTRDKSASASGRVVNYKVGDPAYDTSNYVRTFRNMWAYFRLND